MEITINRLTAIFIFILIGIGSLSAQTVWLDNLDLSTATQGYGIPMKNKSVGGNTLTIAGKTFKRGFGTHAVSSLVILLDGKASEFSAQVGIDDEVTGYEPAAAFELYADGKKIWSSGIMHLKDTARYCSVPLTGVKKLELVVIDGGNGNYYDHADWVNAKFETDAPREIYQFGQKGDTIYDAIDKYINLRYRLLPYIYSTSWDVTNHQSSMMRALMMDFAKDKQALDINDEYMFGKSLRVCPVTTAMYSKDTEPDFSTVKSKELYLPKGTEWVDFWTGDKLAGGQSVKKETPIDVIPLYVKAGSILPFGPEVQYPTQKKWDDLEIRVYPGADGKFTLYEDENDNYDYEKGVYSTITFTWNEAKKVLTIDDRKGSFPGMLQDRSFRIVKVSKDKGIGDQVVETIDKVVSYDGGKVTVKL